ncbi:MAG: DUF3300 domain-containing protein [Desulfuromonadales bacterium]|nr:DUF3300 domain-containing protein [Desulfuromonadales bacterium]
MKKAATFHPPRALLILAIFVFSLVLSPRQAPAQQYEDRYSREEISQMLAPVALYPDPLLAQILMAATYPLELIEADRWVKRNPQVQGDALDAALLYQDWDPSVKALSHFPSILALMSERITETTHLGNAFLAQEPEVMEVVQNLRARAHARGNLVTTSQQKIIVQQETIIIQPANPRVIFVPYYDPLHVYGPWWYAAYPPYYWGPSGVRLGLGISYWPGIHFGFTFGNWSYFDWHRHYIHIDVYQRPRFVRQERWISTSGRWHHHPVHRRGVAYHHPATAVKYGQPPQRATGIRRDSHNLSNRSDRGRSPGLGVERIRVERDRRGDDRSRHERERERQDRDRLERDWQQRQMVERDQQVRERTARDQQARERAEREKQVSDRAAPGQQIRERAEREKQVREKANRDQKERDRSDQIEEGKGERSPGERGQPGQRRVDQGAGERGSNRQGAQPKAKSPRPERDADARTARQQR